MILDFVIEESAKGKYNYKMIVNNESILQTEVKEFCLILSLV